MNKAASRIKKDGVYVAVTGISSSPEGWPMTVAPGTRLRGDHPLVQHVPRFFAPDGTSDEDLARLRAEIQEEASAGARASAKLPDEMPMRIQEMRLRAIRDLTVEVDGQRSSVKKGDVIGISDPLGTLAPTAFEKILVDK